MPKTFTEDQRRHFYELHQSGQSISQISQTHDVSKSSLYQWFKQYSTQQIVDGKAISGRDIYVLEKEAERHRRKIEIYHCSNCTPASSLDEKMRAMHALKDRYSIHVLSNAFDVRRSTFYHYLKGLTVKTTYTEHDEQLCPAIREVFEQSRGRLGAKKIRVKLIERGFTVGPNIIAQLMKEMGLSCVSQKSSRWTNNREPNKYRHNKLRRNFSQEAPNLVWVSDITYVKIGGEFHYIFAIIDQFSRKVVGYRISANMDVSTLINLFEQTYLSRNSPSELLHSDQGAQYTSYPFRQYLKSLKVAQSFTEPGVPYDNSVAESFFASLKKEELHRNIYDTIEQLQASVDEYIHFYNCERPHYKLAMKTPC